MLLGAPQQHRQNLGLHRFAGYFSDEVFHRKGGATICLDYRQHEPYLAQLKPRRNCGILSKITGPDAFKPSAVIRKILELTRQPGSHGHALLFFCVFIRVLRAGLSRSVAGEGRGQLCRLMTRSDSNS